MHACKSQQRRCNLGMCSCVCVCVQRGMRPSTLRPCRPRPCRGAGTSSTRTRSSTASSRRVATSRMCLRLCRRTGRERGWRCSTSSARLGRRVTRWRLSVGSSGTWSCMTSCCGGRFARRGGLAGRRPWWRSASMPGVAATGRCSCAGGRRTGLARRGFTSRGWCAAARGHTWSPMRSTGGECSGCSTSFAMARSLARSGCSTRRASRASPPGYLRSSGLNTRCDAIPSPRHVRRRRPTPRRA